MSEEKSNVQFNAAVVIIPGLIAGVLIALGVPAIILIWGHSLSPNMQITAILTGVGFGGLIGVVSAFFGAVIPSSVNHGTDWQKPGEKSHGAEESNRVV
jgi:hypothetical protein